MNGMPHVCHQEAQRGMCASGLPRKKLGISGRDVALWCQFPR